MFAELDLTRKKDEQMDILSRFFQQQISSMNQQNFIDVLKLSTCQFQSPQQEGDLMLAENNMRDILAQYFQKDQKIIKKLKAQYGDLGDVAEFLFVENNSKNINKTQFTEVMSKISSIYSISGNNSITDKQNEVFQIFDMCESRLQIKFLVRILMKKPRIGISKKSVSNALLFISKNIDNLQKQEQDFFFSGIKQAEDQVFGHSLFIQKQQQQDNKTNDIKQNQQQNNSVNQQQSSDQQNLRFGVPVPVMLAKSIAHKEDLQKQLKKFKTGKILCEIKYDGERTQIHYDEKEGLKLLSRRMELQNSKYENLVKYLEIRLKQLKIQSCILEGEVVPYDKKGNLLDFQSLLSRSQEYEIIHAFDILMYNGQSLLDEPLTKRRQILLQQILDKKPLKISDLQKKNIQLLQKVGFKEFENDQETEIMEYMKEVSDLGYEGLMLKSQENNAIYKPGSRSYWTKLKKFLLKEGQIGDTLDLVPIAVYEGKGKRSGLFGAYLLASYNKNINKYEAICKLGTGFSDEFLERNTKYLQNRSCLINKEQKPSNILIVKSLKPDYWIQDPDQVWEVQCDSFSQSPSYSIGRSDTNPGLSLRFPRFIGERPDKTVKQATDTEQIIDLATDEGCFKNQNNNIQSKD